MKESKKYLKFLSSCKYILIIIPAIFVSLGFVWIKGQSPTYWVEGDFEIQLTKELMRDPAKYSLLVDEVVFSLRHEIGGEDQENQIKIYKVSPLSLRVEANGKSRDSAEFLMQKIEALLFNNGQEVGMNFRLIGKKNEGIAYTNIVLHFTFMVILGVSLAFIISLIKTYLQRY